MEKNKLQRMIIIGLIVLNLGLIIFIFLGPKGKGPHGRHQEPKHIIIEKLHFDKNQIAAYDDLIKDHQTRIKEARNEQYLIKQTLYKLLNDKEINNDSKDSLIVLIGDNQQKIEQIHFSHFKDIKALCRPEQMADFNELAKELSELFAPPMPKKRD